MLISLQYQPYHLNHSSTDILIIVIYDNNRPKDEEYIIKVIQLRKEWRMQVKMKRITIELMKQKVY